MTIPIAQPITIEFKDLLNSLDSLHIEKSISQAFGNQKGCYGILVISNIPGLVEKRARLLKLASVFASLSNEIKAKSEHVPSSYLFGWSHGKEIMNGKRDTAKGSFYNNPTLDDPQVDEIYTKKYPEYGFKNVWPHEDLPELKEAFMDLGGLIVDVGKELAKHCDLYLARMYSNENIACMNEAIGMSKTLKARLLHYFPHSVTSSFTSSSIGDSYGSPDTLLQENVQDTQENVQEKNTNQQETMDSWCGLHLDHSLLTGLTSAMYVNDKTGQELDENDPKYSHLFSESGLYIKDRDASLVKVNIPKDCLAFQIGEAAQVISKGLLEATPHLVKGVSVDGISRNTFAVFLQPNVDFKLNNESSFDDFTKQVMKRHYTS